MADASHGELQEAPGARCSRSLRSATTRQSTHPRQPPRHPPDARLPHRPRRLARRDCHRTGCVRGRRVRAGAVAGDDDGACPLARPHPGRAPWLTRNPLPAAVWADAAAEWEREIRDLIGPATVILADGKPVLYRRITRHQNVTWVQDSLVRANRKAAGDELRRIAPR